MRYKNIIFLIIFILAEIQLFSQGNVVGGISISDDTIPPHPSAILEIRSASRGVLIPEMTSSERDNISNPAQGLLVFVTDTTEMKGLWYFDNQWTQVKFRKPYYPIGSIIMYDGLVDGYFDESGRGIDKMAGWHICNGKDYTPDLTDMFVVGYSSTDNDYKSYGPSHASTNKKIKGPENSYVLTDSAFPSHTHEIKDTVVKKLFTHSHDLKTINQGNSYEDSHELKYIDGRRGRPGYDLRRMVKSKKDKEYAFQESGLGLLTMSNLENIEGDFSLTFKEAGAKDPKPFDNRPSYYTLVYIMRTSAPFQPFNQITNPKTN